MQVQEYDNNLIIPLGEKYGYDTFMKYRCMIGNHEMKNVAVQWDVYFLDGEGNKVETKMLHSMTLEQNANNTTLVHPQTGEIIPPEDYENHEFLMGEYDFYWMIANEQPMQLTDIILSGGEKFKTRVLNQI